MVLTLQQCCSARKSVALTLEWSVPGILISKGGTFGKTVLINLILRGQTQIFERSFKLILKSTVLAHLFCLLSLLHKSNPNKWSLSRSRCPRASQNPKLFGNKTENAREVSLAHLGQAVLPQTTYVWNSRDAFVTVEQVCVPAVWRQVSDPRGWMSPLGLALLATPGTVQAGNAGAVLSGSASQTSSWPDSNSPVHPSWALRDMKPGVFISRTSFCFYCFTCLEIERRVFCLLLSHNLVFSRLITSDSRISQTSNLWGLPGGSVGKDSAIQETRVRSLGWEDPLEKGTATHSSLLAWRIPGTEQSDTLWSIGSQRVGHVWSDLAAAAATWDRNL